MQYIKYDNKNSRTNAGDEFSLLLLGGRPIYAHYHCVVSLVWLQGHLIKETHVQYRHRRPWGKNDKGKI